MIPRYLPFLFVLIFLCQISPLVAQDTKTTPEWARISSQYDNLPKEKKEEFQRFISRAATLLKADRIFEALDILWQAGKISPGHPNVFSLLGVAEYKFQNFPKAQAYLGKANRIFPDALDFSYNLAEMFFVQKDWKTSYEKFTIVIEKHKPAKGESPVLIQLSEFKSLLCCLKLGRMDEAQKRATSYTEYDDSPLFYLVNAAIAYQKGDHEIANELRIRARKIFGKEIIDLWEESFNSMDFFNSLGAEKSKT